MTQDNRIKGGQIDRSRTFRFTFDGHPYTGHPGDTLASARARSTGIGAATGEAPGKG